MASKRVLVVEADQKILRIMVDTLESRGCSVDTCSNGREAFRLAMAQDYDLITVNLKIPGMDGCLVIDSITLVKPSTRIILVSAAFDSTSNIRKAIERAVATLSLPLKEEEITEVLTSLVI